MLSQLASTHADWLLPHLSAFTHSHLGVALMWCWGYQLWRKLGSVTVFASWKQCNYFPIKQLSSEEERNNSFSWSLNQLHVLKCFHFTEPGFPREMWVSSPLVLLEQCQLSVSKQSGTWLKCLFPFQLKYAGFCLLLHKPLNHLGGTIDKVL